MVAGAVDCAGAAGCEDEGAERRSLCACASRSIRSARLLLTGVSFAEVGPIPLDGEFEGVVTDGLDEFPPVPTRVVEAKPRAPAAVATASVEMSFRILEVDPNGPDPEGRAPYSCVSQGLSLVILTHPHIVHIPPEKSTTRGSGREGAGGAGTLLSHPPPAVGPPRSSITTLSSLDR